MCGDLRQRGLSEIESQVHERLFGHGYGFQDDADMIRSVVEAGVDVVPGVDRADERDRRPVLATKFHIGRAVLGHNGDRDLVALIDQVEMEFHLTILGLHTR